MDSRLYIKSSFLKAVTAWKNTAESDKSKELKLLSLNFVTNYMKIAGTASNRKQRKKKVLLLLVATHG